MEYKKYTAKEMEKIKFNIPERYQKEYYYKKTLCFLYNACCNEYLNGKCTTYINDLFDDAIEYESSNNLLIPTKKIHNENGHELSLTMKLILALDDPRNSYLKFLRYLNNERNMWADINRAHMFITEELLKSVTYDDLLNERTIGPKSAKKIMDAIEFVLDEPSQNKEDDYLIEMRVQYFEGYYPEDVQKQLNDYIKEHQKEIETIYDVHSTTEVHEGYSHPIRTYIMSITYQVKKEVQHENSN